MTPNTRDMQSRWTPDQEEVLDSIRQLAELEMTQAYDICANCNDKFVMAKTYNYVYKKGKNKDIPKQFRDMATREDRSIWTPEFTEEVIRIAQAGIQAKMDYVRRHFLSTYGDDIEKYGFSGCTGSAMLMLAFSGLAWAALA